MTGEPTPDAPASERRRRQAVEAAASARATLSPIAIEAALADLSAEVTQDAVERLRRAERLRREATATTPR